MPVVLVMGPICAYYHFFWTSCSRTYYIYVGCYHFQRGSVYRNRKAGWYPVTLYVDSEHVPERLRKALENYGIDRVYSTKVNPKHLLPPESRVAGSKQYRLALLVGFGCLENLRIDRIHLPTVYLATLWLRHGKHSHSEFLSLHIGVSFFVLRYTAVM